MYFKRKYSYIKDMTAKTTLKRKKKVKYPKKLNIYFFFCFFSLNNINNNKNKKKIIIFRPQRNMKKKALSGTYRDDL